MITASLAPWIASRIRRTAAFFVAAALYLFGALAWLVFDPNKRLDFLLTRNFFAFVN